MRRLILLIPLLIILTSPAFAHNQQGDGHEMSAAGHDHAKMQAMAAKDSKVEVVEQLGKTIPLDLTFTDASGKQVLLSQLIDRPTLVVPVYYECRNVCDFLLGGLAQVLPQLKLKAGKDYNIVTFSIDPSETSVQAAHSKKTFFNALQTPFPAGAWHFLTGDKTSVHRLTAAAGYYYKKVGNEFLHPVIIFVVTKSGKIVRYLPGQRFVPLDLTMSLIEAREDRIGVPIRKALQFCFSYDPQGRKYTFNLLRVSATVILLFLGSFLLFLMLSGRKKKKK